MDLEQNSIQYQSVYCDRGGVDQTAEMNQQRRMVSALIHGQCEPQEYLRYLENNQEAMLLLADDNVLRKLLGRLLRYFHLSILELRERMPEDERQRKTLH